MMTGIDAPMIPIPFAGYTDSSMAKGNMTSSRAPPLSPPALSSISTGKSLAWSAHLNPFPLPVAFHSSPSGAPSSSSQNAFSLLPSVVYPT